MIDFILLVSRQGKVRLSRFFTPSNTKSSKEIISLVLHRSNKLCNVIEWRDMKIVFRRYASLYFVVGIDSTDNELLALETIHHFVEILDRYFGNVCELDLIFNFHKAYYILDELILNGMLIESSKRTVLKNAQMQDQLMQDVETIKRTN
jgi:AP-1 complex subunit sigma 1/2